MNLIDLDEEIQKELNTIEDESILTSSRKQIHSAINRLVSFLKEKRLSENMHQDIKKVTITQSYYRI